MALVPLSTQPVITQGRVAVGARLFAFDAGTTTPRRLFLSSALDPARVHPSPVIAADGTWPVMFTGAGDYDLRVMDDRGAQIHFYADLPGEAAAATGNGFDPLRQLPTGAVLAFYGTGRRNGFVRASGGTIGNASADASERANDDCHDLFVMLWMEDPNLTVLGGRSPLGAETDWEAGKTIALPDYRGRFAVCAADGQAIGTTGGAATHTLTVAEMPSHGHGASFAGTQVPNHNHNPQAGNETQQHIHSVGVSSFTILQGTATPVTFFAVPQTGTGSTPTSTSTESVTHSHAITESDAGGHTPAGSVTVNATGSGTAFPTLPPFLADTVYLKL